ncbi:hypothetical protein ACUN0C_19100 [Faunimonas sp. B44]|uniref:hypothetical protein n=1 Tax=Faunimonas sp. B44 TaxID=3461493 RepID=UPI004044A548
MARPTLQVKDGWVLFNDPCRREDFFTIIDGEQWFVWTNYCRHFGFMYRDGKLFRPQFERYRKHGFGRHCYQFTLVPRSELERLDCLADWPPMIQPWVTPDDIGKRTDIFMTGKRPLF